MDGFEIQQGRVFTQVKDSEKYVLFLTNSNPNHNIVIIIPAPPGTRPDASPLQAGTSPSTRVGVGHGSGASDSRNLVSVVVVVVVFIVIVVVLVHEFDIGCRLREKDGYSHVNHQHGIFVVVVLYPFPPSAEMIIVFPIIPNASAIGEEEVEDEGPARSSLATTESLQS